MMRNTCWLPYTRIHVNCSITGTLNLDNSKNIQKTLKTDLLTVKLITQALRNPLNKKNQQAESTKNPNQTPQTLNPKP